MFFLKKGFKSILVIIFRIFLLAIFIENQKDKKNYKKRHLSCSASLLFLQACLDFRPSVCGASPINLRTPGARNGSALLCLQSEDGLPFCGSESGASPHRHQIRFKKWSRFSFFFPIFWFINSTLIFIFFSFIFFVFVFNF